MCLEVDVAQEAELLHGPRWHCHIWGNGHVVLWLMGKMKHKPETRPRISDSNSLDCSATTPGTMRTVDAACEQVGPCREDSQSRIPIHMYAWIGRSARRIVLNSH